MKPYYDDGQIQIWHGDCREIIPDLPIYVDDGLVATDPPYGIDYMSSHDASWDGTKIQNDETTEARDWVLDRWKGPAVVFGSWKRPRPEDTRAVLIWDKGPAFGMGDLSFPWKNSFEEIYVIGEGWTGRRDEGVIRGHIQVSWESKGRKHPNQKPVSLMQYLIGKHSAETVLDPFMGSGSTLRAAKDLGRKAIGIEIEEKYCEIAVDRLAQGVLQFDGVSAVRGGEE